MRRMLHQPQKQQL